MGRWLRNNWWMAIAAVLGAMLVAMGVLLPFEDRTTGALVGGIVIALFGGSLLGGIVVRRRNRRVGAVMMAVGTLPTFPFFWTIVLPILGLAVFIPALLDASDASVQGTTAISHAEATSDRVLVLAGGVLVAAIVASLVVGSQTAAAALCSPPLAVIAARLVQRRLTMPSRLAEAGLLLFLTGTIHAVLLVVVVLGGDETIDLGAPVAVASGMLVSASGALGLVVWVVAMVTARGGQRSA